MRFIFILPVLCLLTNACTPNDGKSRKVPPLHLSSLTKAKEQHEIIDPSGTDIKERINPPEGFERSELDTNAFGYYLRHLPLKPHGSSVLYYNGYKKTNKNVYCAVVDKSIGNRDLHQCADAVIRLKADYHYGRNEYDQIHFNFTNGFNAEYEKWRKGQRIRVNNNSVHWVNTSHQSSNNEAYWSYLEMVFSYAGTLSLSQELKPVLMEKAMVGDVLIQGGSPGHAVIIVDKCIDKASGKELFLLAQSYMPAQEIQLLNNPNDLDKSPWYDLKNMETIHTPEWTFYVSNLKRFQD